MSLMISIPMKERDTKGEKLKEILEKLNIENRVEVVSYQKEAAKKRQAEA